jgi:hypothetical protein
MKLFRLFACVLVLCSMATFNSCQKDDMDEPRYASPIKTKGGLLFHVVDGQRQEIEGVIMSIARSEFDLHHSTYIATRVTDIKGRADFGQLTKGDYFYSAEVIMDGRRYYREGVVHVQVEKDVIRDVVMK